MNFTSSPFERMMKEVPHPGWDNDDPCKGCRYYKECKGKKKQCRKKLRDDDDTSLLEPLLLDVVHNLKIELIGE